MEYNRPAGLEINLPWHLIFRLKTKKATLIMNVAFCI
jgi:hypothetical protein